MYDRFGSTSNRTRQHPNHQQHQHFTFTEEDIEDIYRQFFQTDNDENAEFLFSHIFHRRAPKIINSKSSIEQIPFPFYRKTIYFVQSDSSYNQRIDSYRVRYPFEKSNREYGREILEIIRYLLQSLPGFKSFGNGSSETINA